MSNAINSLIFALPGKFHDLVLKLTGWRLVKIKDDCTDHDTGREFTEVYYRWTKKYPIT